MKDLVLVFLVAFSGVSQAAVNYVCNCGTGADAACKNGSDAAAGTSSATAWQTSTKIQAIFSTSVPANGQILACRGGAWTGVTGFSLTARAGGSPGLTTKASPFTFGAYTPHWGGAGAKPKFTFTLPGDGAAIYLSGYGPQSGLVIRDLNFVGPNNSKMSGIVPAFHWSNITIDNVTIDAFQYGITSSANWAATGIGPITVRNSTLINNRNNAIFSGSNDLLVEDNAFDNNGSCLGGPEGDGGGCQLYRHTFYVAGGTAANPQRNIVFRGNTVTRNAYQKGYCDGTIITGHGVIHGYIVENNYIDMAAANGGCYGIGYSPNPYSAGYEGEGVHDMVIRGNTVINVPYSVNCNACLRPVMENNVLISTNGVSTGLISVSASADKNPTHHLATDKITIRNNSIYVASGTGNAITIGDSTGTGGVVVNNLIYVAGGSMNCWYTAAKTASDFTEFDYNLCRNLGSGSRATLSGTNSHSLTTNPLLRTNPPVASAWDMQIQTTSPARDAGAPSGRGAPLAIHGYPAVGTRDIGAYEHGGNP